MLFLSGCWKKLSLEIWDAELLPAAPHPKSPGCWCREDGDKEDDLRVPCAHATQDEHLGAVSLAAPVRAPATALRHKHPFCGSINPSSCVAGQSGFDNFNKKPSILPGDSCPGDTCIQLGPGELWDFCNPPPILHNPARQVSLWKASPACARRLSGWSNHMGACNLRSAHHSRQVQGISGRSGGVKLLPSSSVY